MRQLVNPSHNKKAHPLLHAATTRRALMDAWYQVKPRVTKSKNAKVRAEAEAFAKDIDSTVHRLQRALRDGNFEFAPQHGFLKRGKNSDPKKKPRPIVVAPVISRVVQRAVLDLCQSKHDATRRLLGDLPKVIDTPTSVSGLPDRGVPEALSLIKEAIADGATWFVRSDLKSFFQTIPKERIETFLKKNVSDKQFVALFMRALATELENEDEVREMLHLFPGPEIGVPQGSALSALCANIVLAEFDKVLNGRGVRTVRYLDDFIILGPNKAAVMKAWGQAQRILSALGMECHDPRQGTGKAALGEIARGFEFLSFYIDAADIYPTSSARSEFIEELADTIREAKALIATPDETRRAEPRFVQSQALLDRKIRGWGDAFSATTKRLILSQLDKKIDEMLDEFRNWFERLCKGKSHTHQRRLLGIALLIDAKEEVSD